MRAAAEWDELLDVEEAFAAFEVAETCAKRELLTPRWVRDGVAGGRLVKVRRVTHLVHRRLAFRSYAYPGNSRCVVLRAIDTGEVVRLPCA